jgi:hypothetical protein
VAHPDVPPEADRGPHSHARRQPNAPVELGYRTAVAAHMAYRQRRRVTQEEAIGTAGR